MLTYESWEHYVDRVPEGQKRRFAHDCGGGATLLVSNGSDGPRAWCFRCNDGGSLPPPRRSLEEIARIIASNQQADSVCSSLPRLPEPAVHDVDAWPANAKLWLYRAGLGKPEIAKLGAYWHVPTSRVVLPVQSVRGEVVYWQARSVDGRKPKYIGAADTREQVVAAYGTRGTCVVLTEDILSAFKVGLQFHSVSLLGTSLSAVVANYVAGLQCLACVWLDPDAPGQAASRKVVRKLSLMGVRTAVIQSPIDPKLMTHEQIASAVTAAGSDT
jgi:DNA primase